MPTYPILPSLSRAPAYESTRKVEDGTIADPMESGYVATRPRFTRLRRTFGVSYKFLSALDVQVLDKFEVSTVMGKAGAFYMPNLLANGNFATFDGWTLAPNSPFVTTIPDAPPDGIGEVVFTLPQGASIPPGSTDSVVIQQADWLKVNAGDQMLFNGRVNVANVTPPGFTLGTYPIFDFDAGTRVAGLPTFQENGFSQVSLPFTVPAGASEMMVSIYAAAINNGTGPFGSDGSPFIKWDECGLAITSAAQPYGRMPGAAALGMAVRFSKGLQVKDRGWVNGEKRYDVTFEVTEV